VPTQGGTVGVVGSGSVWTFFMATRPLLLDDAVGQVLDVELAGSEDTVRDQVLGAREDELVRLLAVVGRSVRPSPVMSASRTVSSGSAKSAAEPLRSSLEW